MKKQWGRRLVFAQGTVWEPWIQWHKVGTHIRVVTRPTSHPPHTSRTSKTFGSVCYCTRWNRCVYFDRLLGSTWRTPSWRTNRSWPALIHLFGDLLLTFLSLHYFLTSCCMLWQISSPPDIFRKTDAFSSSHFPGDWCRCCLMHHQMHIHHSVQRVEVTRSRVPYHDNKVNLHKFGIWQANSKTSTTIDRSRIVQEGWPWIYNKCAPKSRQSCKVFYFLLAATSCQQHQCNLGSPPKKDR